MGPIVLDTSIVIAWMDPGDSHHANVVRTLAGLESAGERFAISAVGYAELMSHRSRKQRDRMREFVDALGGQGVIAVDRKVAERAGELRAGRPSLRTPDALIAATAEVSGSGRMLTADRSLAKLDGAQYVGASRR